MTANFSLQPDPEWDDIVRGYLHTYIWYHTENKTRVGWCSRCGQLIEADRNDTDLFHDFYTKKHNDFCRCPHCLTLAQLKTEGRMKTCSTLGEDVRLLFVDVQSPERVILHGCYIWAEYNCRDAQAELSYQEEVRYILTPGDAEIWRYRWCWDEHQEKWNRKFKKGKTITEPWQLTNNGHCVTYNIAGLEKLSETFLKYVPFDYFTNREYIARRNAYGTWHTDRVPWGRILSYAAKYPAFEMAVKLDMWGLLEEFVSLGNGNHRYINWAADNLRKFFRKIPFSGAKRIIEDGANMDKLKFYRHVTPKLDDVFRFERKFSYAKLDEFCRKHNEDKLTMANYLYKQSYGDNGFSVLSDYWEFAKELDRDLTVHNIRYPKKLSAQHDEYHDAVMAIRAEKKAAADAAVRASYPETYKNYRRLYEFVTDEYMAKVPELLSDITLEGKNQHHCVGSYVGRHAEGKTIIIFIRRTMYPLIPLYTAEISPDGKLRQVQGYNNRYENKPTPEADAFIQSWLKEVSRRLQAEAKKNKKNKSEDAA